MKLNKERPFIHTVEGALIAAQNNQIQDWVLDYLDADPYQRKLQEIIRERPNFWIGPVEYPLHRMTRITGVEETWKYREDEEQFEGRIKKILDGIQSGWKPVPLFLTDFFGGIHLSDGNHRHEAFVRLGYKKYWAIFQSTTIAAQNQFLNTLK